MTLRKPALVLTALCLGAGTASSGKSGVIRVGTQSELIGDYNVGADPTLTGAVRIFGAYSRCRALRDYRGFAEVVWRAHGIRMVFGTYGPFAVKRGVCRSVKDIRLDAAYAYGKQWRTGRGLRVGDSVSRLRQLYPSAFLRTNKRGLHPLRGWWLVLQYSRVPDPHAVPALMAVVRDGRVAELVVNVGAEGD